MVISPSMTEILGGKLAIIASLLMDRCDAEDAIGVGFSVDKSVDFFRIPTVLTVVDVEVL